MLNIDKGRHTGHTFYRKQISEISSGVDGLSYSIAMQVNLTSSECKRVLSASLFNST